MKQTRQSLAIYLLLVSVFLTPVCRGGPLWPPVQLPQQQPAPQPSPVASPSPVLPAQKVAPATTLSELQTKISEILAKPELASAMVGVKVVSLDNGRVLFEKNAHKLLRP